MSIIARLSAAILFAAAVLPLAGASSVNASLVSRSDNCQSNEFWWEPRSCCLPHGGPPSNPPSPPKGKTCPTDNWSWHNEQGCCVPHHPNPPAPSCPSGWDWHDQPKCCQTPPPSSSTSSWPKPSGHYKRAVAHKSRAEMLCPQGLNACPIPGLSGYGTDYECLDVQTELESCGGCASTGAGVDCTSIKGANAVGCESGTCAIYTCKAGFRRSADGKSCVAA
ncbi:hypothetical protein PLICRDRAFT_424813 [Plicaturopsis crispa FD-325 SS-3]|nr:hypothetical protein PLICRDRAFT_424813 [Plicaturopsis crispa FD-325 SS-3]